IGSIEMEIARQLSQKRYLKNVLRFHGRLTKPEALKRLLHSDMLLYFTYPDACALGWVPSKLYDYLMLKKPIFAVGLNGEASEIIRRAGAGFLVNPFDLDRINARLFTCLQKFEKKELNVDPALEFISCFERRFQVKELSQLFESFIPHIR
ncbi:hypothetical protein MJD09_04610, partial [bacterium]|nr:hypothetical protein [bacterium]